MTEYNVKHTDSTVPNITVDETEVNTTAVDIPLFGRINLEYGEALNDSLLNILENFACPESSATTNIFDAVPDLVETSNGQLSNPTIGQFWFNSTRETIYYWTGDNWYPLPQRENYAANWGTIMDGGQLPRPVSPLTGYTFNYDECIWAVAPAVFDGGKIGYMSCATDSTANVQMRYRMVAGGTMISGLANYLIIGVKGNTNNGIHIPPIEVTPTPSPTATVTVTPTPAVSPSATLTPTPTRTPGASATATPTPTRTRTVTPTPGASSTVTPTRTRSPTPTPGTSVTPTRTPTVSPVVEISPNLNNGFCVSTTVQDAGYVAGMGFRLMPNGQAVFITSANVVVAGTWYTSGINPNNYEVRFTGTATGPGTSAPGTWLNLGTQRQFYNENDFSPNVSGVTRIDGLLEIRNASTLAVVASITLRGANARHPTENYCNNWINPTPVPTLTPTPTPTPQPAAYVMCPCPGMAYWGGAYYQTMTGTNYATYAECELIRSSMYPQYWCDSTTPTILPPGAACWSIFNPNLQWASMNCEVV